MAKQHYARPGPQPKTIRRRASAASIPPGLGVRAHRRRSQHVRPPSAAAPAASTSALFSCMCTPRAAGVAVRHPRAVLERRVGVRIARGVQFFLQQMHGIVQEIGVAVADRKMQLALELRSQRGPVALQDRGQIVVIDASTPPLCLSMAPVSGSMTCAGYPSAPAGENTACQMSHCSVERPCVPSTYSKAYSAPASAMMDAVRLAVGGNGHLAKVALAHKRVRIVVEVDVLVGVEIDRIGAGHLRAVVDSRDRRPAWPPLPIRPSIRRTLRAPIPAPMPRYFFSIAGISSSIDGRAVRAHVGRVHIVGIVVIGVRVLHVDQDHARQPARCPVLEEAGSRSDRAR